MSVGADDFVTIAMRTAEMSVTTFKNIPFLKYTGGCKGAPKVRNPRWTNVFHFKGIFRKFNK